MPLLNRVLLVLALTFILMGSTALLIHREIILPSFLALEKQHAEADANRILSAIENELRHLDMAVNDWSAWDDTYAFVQDRNNDYVVSNLVDSTFAINQVNLVLILDAQDRVVWVRAFDLEADAPLDAGSLAAELLAAGSPLGRISVAGGSSIHQGVRGLFRTPLGPMLCAARPILDSQDRGPARGVFLMGRLLTRTVTATLARQTGLDFELRPIPSPAGFDPAGGRVDLPDSSEIDFRFAEESIATTILMTGLDGRPALEISRREPRAILAQGEKALRVALVLFACGTLLVLGLMLALLKRAVITPLKQVTDNILGIRSSGERRSVKVASSCASREICSLADEFDRLMDSLAAKSGELATVNEDLRQETAKLKEAELALKNLDQLKSEFISTAAHELRTPVASVMGYAELIAERDRLGPFTDDQVQEFLREIFDNCDGLTKIVDDILDVSRIEAGKSIPLQRQPVHLVPLLERVVKRFRIKSVNQLLLEISPDLPETVFIDPQRITQVMENLLSNAIKYSPRGGPVRVAAGMDGEECRITVADQGIGMTPEQVSHVFDKFYRADASDTAVRGLGLGMSIVRQILLDHGGSIRVESSPGEGTRVVFALPGEIPREEAPLAPAV